MAFSRLKLLSGLGRFPRQSLDQLSIKSKLILMLLLASGLSTLLTALLGYRSGQINLTNRVFNQLTSIRASKAYQIESYFRNIQNHTQTLSEDLSIVAAVQQFDAAFQQLDKAPPPAGAAQALETYYRKEFLPRLNRRNAGTPNLEAYLPIEPAARTLQTLYLATNPHPVGKKQGLVAASDGNAYSELHRRYHPEFRNIVAKFGYYDMFLINPQGEIVYTVFKETDFATNLQTGPYKDSNLARLVNQVIASKQKNFTQLEDFAAYAPSYGAPASFIAIRRSNQVASGSGIALQHFAPGGKVIRQGRLDHELYIIITGQAMMSVRLESDEDVEILPLRSGEFFGEMTLFSGGQRSNDHCQPRPGGEEDLGLFGEPHDRSPV